MTIKACPVELNSPIAANALFVENAASPRWVNAVIGSTATRSKQIFSALVCAAMAPMAHADDTSENTLPADLRQALEMPDWFRDDAMNMPDLLDATVQSLLANSDPALRDVDMDRILQMPMGAFEGVLFGQVNKRLNPRDSSDGEVIYDIGETLDAPDMPPLQDAFRMTQCYVVSENDLKDGFATAFQFSENEETGYSLSFVIFDYQGPGTYTFDESTLNYMRYAPSAVVGMVVATRHIEGVATVVGQFTSPGSIGGSLTLRELPDGSMCGSFDMAALGSTDRVASRDGATDAYFASQFYGVFRTGSIAEPVVVEFVPRPMIGAGADTPPPPPTPTSNVQVMARSGQAACPTKE